MMGTEIRAACLAYHIGLVLCLAVGWRFSRTKDKETWLAEMSEQRSIDRLAGRPALQIAQLRI